MRRIAVVTTFSKEGWDKYAKRSVETFDKMWPQGVELHCYPDARLKDEIKSPRIFYHYDDIPERTKFIKTWGVIPAMTGHGADRYNYRFDAVKFCHKPFVLSEFARFSMHDCTPPYDGMIWVDADTVTHSAVPLKVVQKDMAPKDKDFCYLGRNYKYSECGFMFFNLARTQTYAFLQRVLRFYRHGTFQTQKEWHDSFLFDQARAWFEQRPGPNTPIFHSYSPPDLHRRHGGGHPFVNSFLGAYMDHLKGDVRKLTGKPRKQDMVVGHDQKYWREL